MAYLILGINHKKAPLALREQMAFTDAQLPQALLSLCRDPLIHEAVILSTCNRTELYLYTEHKDIAPVIAWLADHHGLVHHLSRRKLSDLLYNYWQKQAMEHAVRVASGLDSMVLGESQILSQIKAAYHTAVQAGTTAVYLGRFFPHIFTAAKRIRSHTDIGRHPVSVAYVAVKLAQQLFSHIAQRRFLLVGAGKTIQLIAQYLRNHHMEHLAIANRSRQHALHLVDVLNIKHTQIKIYTLEELVRCLPEADVVFVATASAVPLISRTMVEQAMRKRKYQSMMLLDLAVPRNVAEDVGGLEDVYLYTVDHLQSMADEGQERRKQAAAQAELLVMQEVTDFMNKLQGLAATAGIRSILGQVHTLREAELARAMEALKKGSLPEKIIYELAYRLTAKIMHQPIIQMKKAAETQDERYIALAEHLWQTENEEDRDDREDGE